MEEEKFPTLETCSIHTFLNGPEKRKNEDLNRLKLENNQAKEGKKDPGKTSNGSLGGHAGSGGVGGEVSLSRLHNNCLTVTSHRPSFLYWNPGSMAKFHHDSICWIWQMKTKQATSGNGFICR
ncbi:hypothetical protein DV515_00010684 [Chloebia gouldiae]|uniref:Uncharacterized protein n=1 Tax=Chloebia gouldiae TaxID=44316 RepID=A0A3L8S8F5_CHLGU|nr:hypothetical protein DV515_00010684 [Chloebia gouldiae]